MADLNIHLSDSQLRILAQKIDTASDVNRWRNKSDLAAYFSCSVRTVEQWLADGGPFQRLAGKPVARVGELETWLRETGRMVA